MKIEFEMFLDPNEWEVVKKTLSKRDDNHWSLKNDFLVKEGISEDNRIIIKISIEDSHPILFERKLADLCYFWKYVGMAQGLTNRI